MRRRNFIAGLASTTAVWPLAARAQQPTMPIVGFVSGRSADASVREVAAFRKGFNETGYVEGQNATTIGWRANTIACHRSWTTSSAVAWR
jgi:putative tryptophan/tyrosine transport system substrate-binding protein